MGELSDTSILSDIHSSFSSSMTSCSDERVIMLEDVLGQDGYDAIEHKEGAYRLSRTIAPH